MNIFNPTRDHLTRESASLAQSYKQGFPYPHLVVDELFDSEILYSLLNEFLFKRDEAGINWQITKDLKLESKTVRRLSDSTRTFYFWLNSPDFIDALTLAIGRKENSLVGDPTLYGAGLCGILPGGKLESICSFITHPHLPLVCEFNLIICLNDSLNSNGEGKIELYSDQKKDYGITYKSKFNRTLILPITDKVKYRISTSDRSFESSKFFSIYYWSRIPNYSNERTGC